MDTRQEEQRRLIVEQFTKQAVPFSEMPHHNDEDTNRLVIETAGIGPEDTVLDVACGPGLITCAVARVARHVTGIDITPAMIEEARKRQQSMGLTNMEWRVGDVLPLPFPGSSFSAVITRYSFHHFLEPEAVLTEMVRVCQPGGRVAVVDVFMSTPEQAEAYNRMEKLRDPSHTRALLLGGTDGDVPRRRADGDEDGVLQARRGVGETADGLLYQARRCPEGSQDLRERSRRGSSRRRGESAE